MSKNDRNKPISRAVNGLPINTKISVMVLVPNGVLGKLATDDKQIKTIGTIIGKNAMAADGSLL